MSKTDQFQTIGTIMALVISIIAMVTSIYEANIMKAQQKAMVWPHLQLNEQYSSDGFGIIITNKGTGPALVSSVQLDFKNTPIQNLETLLDSLNPERTFGFDLLTNNALRNHVFTPGEELVMLWLPKNEETEVILQNKEHIRLRIQYQSVLGEHWLYDSRFNTNSKKYFKAKKEFIN